MPAKGQGKWVQLMASDMDLTRWHRNLARGSQATADNYLRLLGRFLEVNALTPMELVEMDPKARDDVLDDYIAEALAKGRAPATCAVYKKAVVSWLAFHGKKLQRTVKVPGAHVAVKASKWQIPEQGTVRELLNIADGRERVIIALMAFSGLRPQVLGNYDATDGLRLRHFQGLSLLDGEVCFDEIPCAIEVPAELSKTRRPYITFLGPEGCDYLSSYIHERVVAGEDVTMDSIVVRAKRAATDVVRSQKVGDLLRKVLRRIDVQEPPYILRSYFDARLMHAEGIALTRDMRQFMMGHAGDMEHKYTYHKRLPQDTLVQLREGYASALPYLETRRSGSEGPPPRKELARMLLLVHGLSESEVSELDLDHKTDAEIDALLVGQAQPAKPKGPRQRVVSLGDLEEALNEGWKFKQELSDGRILVET